MDGLLDQRLKEARAANNGAGIIPVPGVSRNRRGDGRRRGKNIFW